MFCESKKLLRLLWLCTVPKLCEFSALYAAVFSQHTLGQTGSVDVDGVLLACIAFDMSLFNLDCCIMTNAIYYYYGHL